MIEFSMSELDEIYNNAKQISNHMSDKYKSENNYSSLMINNEITIYLSFLSDIKENITKIIDFCNKENSFASYEKKNKKTIDDAIQDIINKYKWSSSREYSIKIKSYKNNSEFKDQVIIFNDYYQYYNKIKKSIDKIIIKFKIDKPRIENKKDMSRITVLGGKVWILRNEVITPIINDLEDILNKKTSI